MIEDLVFSQAALLAGQLDERQTELLRLLCQAAARSLQQRLREEGLQTGDVVLAAVDGQGSFTVFERQGERVVRHVFL